MVRKSSFAIGIGLALLWAIGLAADRSAAILWFDAVAAIIAFGIAALVDDSSDDPIRAFGPALLGIGLGVLFVVGQSTHRAAWASWLNLLFAVASIGVAILVVSPGYASVLHAHPRGRRR